MTITIHLPPATEERLRAQAVSSGKDVPTLVLEAVEAQLALAPLALAEILRPVHEEVTASGITDDDLDQLLKGSLAEARADRKAPKNGSS